MIKYAILIMGIILLTIGFTRMYLSKDNSQIVYRYIPRTFKEDQENSPPLSDLMGDMFENPEPWTGEFYDEKVKAVRTQGV
jgi:hypothetical protein